MPVPGVRMTALGRVIVVSVSMIVVVIVRVGCVMKHRFCHE